MSTRIGDRERLNRRGRRIVARAALVLATVIGCLALVELGLRACGFRYRMFPERIEFGWPRPTTIRDLFAPDPELFWVPRVPKPYATILEEARRDRARVVFMGCSCTQFGGYPERLCALVEAVFPGKTLAYANVGCGGWSSFQGRQQFARDIAPLEPAVLFIFFGWNDHWIGFGLEDKHVPEINRGSLYSLQSLRIAQLLARAVVALDSQPREAWPRRVSEADFAANLRAIVQGARARGITPILVTAPTSFEHAASLESFSKLKRRHLHDLNELIPLHRRYVERVRDVARRENVVLCDLHAVFDALSEEVVLDSFYADGIHFNSRGSQRIATLMLACLRANGLERAVLGDRD